MILSYLGRGNQISTAMSDLIRNLPEQALYEFVPPLVADLDTRGLIEAVIGGFQDCVADLRSYADRFSTLIEPDPTPYRVVLVQYRTETAGNIVPVTLDVDSTTPDDVALLADWAADQLKINRSQIVSAVVGTDALRQIGIDSTQLLAQSIGAVLYPGLPGEDPTIVSARQRQALGSYFPRLKIKGTAQSFSAFARLAGFDDGQMLPLWTRLSPRNPRDTGHSSNDDDFRPKPDYLPSAQLPDPDGVYNPLDFTDGPFYSWQSGTLTADPASPDFYLTAVNGRNPFIRLATTGPVTNPVPGTYVLDGGASGRSAVAVLSSGTQVSNLNALGLTDGIAFNGLRLTVTGTGSHRSLGIEAQLSTVKYRSSAFDLSLYRVDAGTRAASVNPDLMANPSLVPDGLATAPFRSWGFGTNYVQDVTLWPSRSVTISGSIQPRIQVPGTVVEIDADALVGAAQRVYDLSDEVRAATRTPRRTNAGLLWGDDIRVADYPSNAVLVVTTGTGSFGGIVDQQFRPTGTYSASFLVEAPPAIPLGLTTQTVSNGTFQFGGYGVTGSYFRDSGLWQASVVAGFSAGTVVGHWSDPDPGVIRTEPSISAKLAGTISATSMPEGSFFDHDWNLQTWDDVAWMRPLRLGGEDVDADMFLPFNGDPDPLVQTVRESRVMDIAGIPNRALVYDLQDVQSPPFMRMLPELIREPVTVAMAGSGTSIYPVVAVSPTTIVAEATWNEGRSANAILWWPLNEQPFQPLRPTPALGLTPDVALIRPGDRVWDAERGWALKISPGGTISRADLGLPQQYSFAVTAKTFTSPVGVAGASVRIGAASLTFGQTAVNLAVDGQDGVVKTSVPVFPGTNAIVYVSVGTATSTVGIGDATGWTAQSSVATAPLPGWSGISLSAGKYPTQLHDLMIWDGLRSTTQLNTLRSPVLVPTSVPVQRPYVGGVTSDRWALSLLPSAFVVPTRADAFPEVYPAGEMRRYQGTGRYDGNPAYKQVGLGGSQTIGNTWKLGATGPAVPATGEVVVAGGLGEPGINVSWTGSFGTLYKVIPPYGPTGGDTVISAIVTGTGVDWPVALSNYNSACDRVYIKGDNSLAYEVMIDDLGDGPVFVASLPLRPRPEKELPFVSPALRGGREVVTDFETQLRTDTYELSVNTSGTVYSTSDPSFGFLITEDGFFILTEAGGRFVLEGEFGTKPFYIYLNSRVKSWAKNAFTRWVNPNAYGESLATAALDTAGDLAFENIDPMSAGNYRLSIDSGNIGTVDNQFEGFDVEVVITTGVGDPIVFPAVLLSEGRGTNPRGWTKLEFTLPYDVVGAWRLTLRWTNDRDVPSRGEFRRLAVYGYTMRRIASELMRVLAQPLTITPVDTLAPPLAAGAYVAAYDSYGTIASYRHEQDIYAHTLGTDTFNNPRSPLADTLTGSTLERRDYIDVGTTYTPPDPLVPIGPVAGFLSVSPVKTYYNVGDVVTLSNTGYSPPTPPLRRVWHLWEGGTRVSWADQLTNVQIGRAGTLTMSVDVVDALGMSDQASATVVTNFPPSIQLATATTTFAPVPYQTMLSAIIADTEGDEFATKWYRHSESGSNSFISSGTIVPDYTVEETQTVRVYAVDDRGGTSFADVPLTAGINAAPVASIVSISPKKLKAFPVTNGAVVPPPQKLQIAAVASDPESRGVTPAWTFWDGTTSPGDAVKMPSFGGGTFCSVETTFTPTINDRPGTRAFSLVVTDADGISSEVNGSVILAENTIPVVTHIAVSDLGVKEGTPLLYSATAYDPDGDDIDYVWQFPSLNLTTFGPNVAIDTTGLAGRSIGGTLKVSDGFGGVATVDAPAASVYSGGLAPLAFTPAGGISSQGVVITITSPDLPDAGIVIRYTLDGSSPDSQADGLAYVGPIMLPYVAGTSTPVNARAFKAGLAPTSLAAATFTFSS